MAAVGRSRSETALRWWWRGRPVFTDGMQGVTRCIVGGTEGEAALPPRRWHGALSRRQGERYGSVTARGTDIMYIARHCKAGDAGGGSLRW